MPEANEISSLPSPAKKDWKSYYEHIVQDWYEEEINQEAFVLTGKYLETTTLPHSGIWNSDALIEPTVPGKYNIVTKADDGRPLRFINVPDDHHHSSDPQFTTPSAIAEEDPVLTTEELIIQLSSAGEDPSCRLIFKVELTSFDALQKVVLLPLLRKYIIAHRNSNTRDELDAVGSAIRKYIAIMPMDHMGELAVLLEAGSKSPLPVDLQIEVAKMIYRNFEVHPPIVENPQPALAQQLWEMVDAYTNPRILLQDKHAAIASLAIVAIVSMRSPLAEQAWQAANECGYGWFAELVSDDIDELLDQWSNKDNQGAISWLRNLRTKCSEETIA